MKFGNLVMMRCIVSKEADMDLKFGRKKSN